MEPLVAERLKLMVKVFRRECHRVLTSERTTIHGADSMLRILQLAMAEVNKQVLKSSVYRMSQTVILQKMPCLNGLLVLGNCSYYLKAMKISIQRHETCMQDCFGDRCSSMLQFQNKQP